LADTASADQPSDRVTPLIFRGQRVNLDSWLDIDRRLIFGP
jgi:hypothetical protein